MLKKRVIFTLLYENGTFMLSRNFRLQKVGDISWLKRNYNFSDVAFFIDELIVLDVTRGERDLGKFCETLKALSKGCFAPIAAGGGISSVESARMLLRSGADKVALNSALIENPDIVEEIAREFGQQCVVGSLDLKKDPHGIYQLYVKNGQEQAQIGVKAVLSLGFEELVGEIYLNSIDRDGTGQGYDLDMLEVLPEDFELPVILAGGVGNANHFLTGLGDRRVDAVATAHLFNFIGDGLEKARSALIDNSVELASWPSIRTESLGIQPTLNNPC